MNKFYSGFVGNLSTLKVTSPFGVKRKNHTHSGLDIGIPVGTQMLAPFDGFVYNRSVIKGGGLSLYLQSNENPNLMVVLMHLKSTSVILGDKFTAGTLLALSGGHPSDKPNCGRSTGPHLHIEVRLNRIPYDPTPFFSDTLSTKSGKRFYGSIPPEVYTTELSAATLKSISNFLNNPNESLNELVDENSTEYEEEVKNTNVTEDLAPGIWQIVKLLIDSSVVDKQVANSDISLEEGSLLNFFRKVCQEPLVELMSDTYGSQFYFITRRPPTDQIGYQKAYDYNGITNLSDLDIITTNLKWHSEGGYSWYQFLPTAEMLGIKEATQFVPAVFFSEYASIWGSKPLIVESNYYTYKESGKWNKGDDTNKNFQIANAIEDFKYLIQSNAYLPFTREGVIVTTLNRQLKRGMFVTLPNGEIYHIDSVNHDYSISENVNATTTINVSRGIVADYTSNKKINGRLISYFNIIDFGDNSSEINYSNWREIVSKWKVNPEVFGFFLARQQFQKFEFEKSKCEVTANLKMKS